MKKIIALLLSVLLVACMFPAAAIAEETPEIPEGYTPIYTTEDLDNIRLNMSGKYILMNDLLFTAADFMRGGDFYNSGKGWVPIGNSNNTCYFGNICSFKSFRVSFTIVFFMMISGTNA